MRKFLFLIHLLICMSGYGQVENLKLRYDFSAASPEGVVTDISGNGYDATLKNYAFVDKMGQASILNLGMSKGYLDMGPKTGQLIDGLKSFTISTYVCVNSAADLNANGNFVWNFANSDDIIADYNGLMFFSAKAKRYAITQSDYRAEAGLEVGNAINKNVWQHVVYTQSGYSGTIYIDGQVVKTGNIGIYPDNLGNTKYNYIGRSSYSGDVYLKGLISDFRIYNKALSIAEVQALSTDLPALNQAYIAYQNKPTSYVATQNPLFTHLYTADPAALVHEGKFYIYAGQDTGDGGWYNMPNWVVFSSDDMKTWSQHPVPLKIADFSWAKDNSSWASQVIERNGKFYWYMCGEHASIPGKAIGVAVSDSPTGPFVDARGTALVTNNMTTNWTGISWDDIDPTVWIDDDGQAYMFWGIRSVIMPN